MAGVLTVPSHRGALARSSRTRGGMRWTRQRWARDGIAGRVSRERSPSALTSDAFRLSQNFGGLALKARRSLWRRRVLRTAKSCGPDAPTLASSLRRRIGPTGRGHAISADDGVVFVIAGKTVLLGHGFELPNIPDQTLIDETGPCVQRVMGDYYPVAAWCDNSTFVHGGWCTAARF